MSTGVVLSFNVMADGMNELLWPNAKGRACKTNSKYNATHCAMFYEVEMDMI